MPGRIGRCRRLSKRTGFVYQQQRSDDSRNDDETTLVEGRCDARTNTPRRGFREVSFGDERAVPNRTARTTPRGWARATRKYSRAARPSTTGVNCCWLGRARGDSRRDRGQCAPGSRNVIPGTQGVSRGCLRTRLSASDHADRLTLEVFLLDATISFTQSATYWICLGVMAGYNGSDTRRG